MSTEHPPSLFRLLLCPVAITTVVSALRLLFEVQGSINTASGGGMAWLGISWLVFVFGAVFGWRLRRAGSAPRLRPAWVWSLLALIGLIAAVGWSFGGLDQTDTSDAAYQQLRHGSLMVIALAVPIALFCAVVWTRLAWTLLWYGLAARLVVLAITWLASARGWDTHYTKLGPAGIECEMPEILIAAGAAQLGFWVPFTIVAGTLAGTIGALAARKPR